MTDISYLGLQYPDGWPDKVFSIATTALPLFSLSFSCFPAAQPLRVTASPVHVDFPFNNNPAYCIPRDSCNAACALCLWLNCTGRFPVGTHQQIAVEKKPAMYCPRTREAMGYDTTAYHMSLGITPQRMNSAFFWPRGPLMFRQRAKYRVDARNDICR